MPRHNDGLRKRCRCPARQKSKCHHPWWFGFSWNGREIRFSLHKVLGLSLRYRMSRAEAEKHRDRFRAQIREGTFTDPSAPEESAPAADQRLTFGDLAERYLEEHVRIPTRREGGRRTMEWLIGVLRRTEIPGPAGIKVAFERKHLDQITKADVEALRRVRREHDPRAKRGEAGCNRLLSRLRHMFNWAIAEGIVDHTPFKRHGVTVVKLNGAAEAPRYRRLEEGEEERLLTHANPHLRSIIVAALETGCRLGELLSMQWSQVRWQEGVLLLPADKTKVNEARSVPMTQRIRAVLEMRRLDPGGQELGPEAYVFGNEVGEPVRSIRTAWENCRRRAKVEGLHFHDLRREFASRLLESPGVALHDVAQWIGHANVMTTTRYLAVTGTRLRRTLTSFEGNRRDRSITAEREPLDSTPG